MPVATDEFRTAARVQASRLGRPDLEAVFEPFHRVPGTAAPNGSGLGLAIARGAVELHGGSIVARNMPDGGLGVEIRLPAIRP